jgi:hypothetical protein
MLNCTLGRNTRVISIVFVALAAMIALTFRHRAFGVQSQNNSKQPQFGPDPSTFLVGAAPDGYPSTFKAAETDSIRMTAEVKTQYQKGTPMSIHLTLENERKEDLELMHNVDGDDFYLYLVDHDRKPVPLTEFGSGMANGLFMKYHNQTLQMHPHDSFARDYDIGKYFEIPGPGVYSLTVVKEVMGTTSEKFSIPYFDVVISYLNFEVTSGKPEGEKKHEK